MKAESREYVKLQTLYRQKAAQDIFHVSQNVSQILSKLNRPTTDVTEEEIQLWCKNANHVQRIRYRTLVEEWSVDESHAKAICEFPLLHFSQCSKITFLQCQCRQRVEQLPRLLSPNIHCSTRLPDFL